MQRSKITITKRNDYTVLLSYQHTRYKHQTPYKTLIEVSKDFNPETLKPYPYNKVYSYRLLRNEADPLARWQSKESAENYTSKHAIQKSINAINKQIKLLKLELKTARENLLYKKLKIIADQKIKHYMTDFNFHDCLMIHRKKPTRFIWLVRDTGTFNITDNNSISKSLLNSNTFNHEVYYISYGNIESINHEQANDILNSWKK